MRDRSLLIDPTDALTGLRRALHSANMKLRELTKAPRFVGMVVGLDSQVPSDTLASPGCPVQRKGKGPVGFVTEEDTYSGGLIVDWPDGSATVAQKADLTIPSEDMVTVARGSELTMLPAPSFPLEIGDLVTVGAGPEAHGIAAKVGHAFPGLSGTVMRLVGSTRAEIAVSGNHRLAIVAPRAGQLAVGDQVGLDPLAIVVLEKLSENTQVHVWTEDTKVAWSDIAGLDGAKQAIQEAVVLPQQFPLTFARYHRRPPRGILIEGPPGNGKTMLAKATATSIRLAHGGANHVNTAFCYVRGPEILEKWVGESEAGVRRLFAQARSHMRQHGYPSVICIDEADAILSRRGSGISSDIERTIVPAFLSEMDGIEESGAIVILLTNRPDQIDPAVLREGRVDRKIRVGRPDREAARRILVLHFTGLPLADFAPHGPYIDDEGLEALGINWTAGTHADFAVKEIFDKPRTLYEVTIGPQVSGILELQAGTADERKSFMFSDLISGALLAEIARRAGGFAIRREIEAAKESSIEPADIARAVEEVYQENLEVSHREALDDFCRDFRDRVKGVRTLRGSLA